MAMLFCTQCGRENPDDARFCANCGAPLARPGQPVGTEGDRGVETTSTISVSGLEALDAEPDIDTSHEQVVEALPTGTALLVVKRGPNAGSRFLLDADVTTAGRHPESDIFLDDVTVSRRHAEFVRRDDGSGATFVVRDVGSLNGTYLNRERIEESPLAGGDEVQIGKFRLVFFLGGQPGEAGEGR